MQRIFLFLIFLLSINCFSQGLTVNTATPQALSNSIINQNCIATSNWVVSSGSNFGDANSVGTFARPTNATFPLSGGIVLSTGSLTNIPGPKTLPEISPGVPNTAYSLGDGNNSLWASDTSMNTELGGATNFTNASSLEFDFTSQKTTFELNYVFASEEFGQRQCNAFSDVLVILLTDMVSGTTINIAKTPTTNQIISPNTIRKNQFNTSCADSNPLLFGSYFGNANAPNSPLDMYGHTIEMTAQATILTNHPYKLKIVIADRFDFQFDSAVFIKSYSPIIQNGTFLGPNVQLCEGTPHQITTEPQFGSSQYNFSWRQDGNLIPASNTSTINTSPLTGTSVYKVSITPKIGFCDVNDLYQDSVIIEYIPQQNTHDPIPLNKCVGSTEPYNLSQNTTEISRDLSYTPTITYHETNAAAVSGSNPLSTSYSGSLTTLWVRIVQPGSPCPPLIKQFNLGTTSGPSNLGTIDPVVLCANSTTSLNATLNVNPIKIDILNGQSTTIYGVSFHTTSDGATNNTSKINVLGNGNAIVSSGTVFVRVYVLGSQNCFTTTSFEVTVNSKVVAFKPEPVVYCGPTYILPPLPDNNKYFENSYDGTDPASQLLEILPGTPISIPPGFEGTYRHPTIYVSNLLTDTNSCSEEWPLDITLIQQSSFTETSRTECDEYTLPVLEFGDYWTDVNGTGDLIPGGTTLTETTIIHYNFQSTINEAPNFQCNVPAGPITITIENSPDFGPDRPNVFRCQPGYLLPNLSTDYPGAQYFGNQDGTGPPIPEGTPINTTQTVYAYLPDTGTLACPSVDAVRIVIGLAPIPPIIACNYVLPEPVVGEYWDGEHQADGTCTGCTQLFPGDALETSGTYYLYVPPPPGQTCTATQNQVSFSVTLTQPLVDDIVGFTSPQCGDFILPNLTNGRYFKTSQLGGLGDPTTEVFPGYVVDSNQTIYVYNINSSCDFEKPFDFIINPLPQIDNTVPTFIDVCRFSLNESYELLTPSNGTYYTQTNGGGTIIETPKLITDPTTIYLYNIDPITGCQNERVVSITFSLTETDTPIAPVIEACSSYTLPPLSGNGSRYHDYYWNPTNPGENNSPIVPPTPITNLYITIPNPTQNVYEKTFYIYNNSFDGIREICPQNNAFKVILYRQPNIAQQADIYSCDGLPVTLPTLQVGQKYYNESHLGGATTFTEITGPITSSQTVYIYESINSIEPGSTFKCEDQKSFEVSILKTDTGVSLNGCGEVTIPSLTNGNYFNNPGGNSPISNLTFQNTGTTTITKTIYIYNPSGFPSSECQFFQNSFEITITPIPSTNPVPLFDADPLIIDRTFCDTDNLNDGVIDVVLTQYSTTILGSQTGTEFGVTYHNSFSDAENNLNPITNSLSNNTTLYAVVRNSRFQSCGSPPYQLEFVVNKLPEPVVEDAYFCVNNVTNMPISSATLDSGLSSIDYTFEWYNSTGMPVGSDSTFTTFTEGLYSLVVTDRDLTKNCESSQISASVIKSTIAITGYTITQDFTDNQIITLIPTGLINDYVFQTNNYLYQLDNSIFQESNVFVNVPSGLHTLVIRDKNGCGDSAPIEVLILNYPKFFTPNNDSFNDFWNIYDLQELNDPKAKISIFDRMGKLIKQISPYGDGWDGLYNGKPLSSDDYWFTVTYVREGISREFKSHFSLKR